MPGILVRINSSFTPTTSVWPQRGIKKPDYHDSDLSRNCQSEYPSPMRHEDSFQVTMYQVANSISSKITNIPVFHQFKIAR